MKRRTMMAAQKQAKKASKTKPPVRGYGLKTRHQYSEDYLKWKASRTKRA